MDAPEEQREPRRPDFLKQWGQMLVGTPIVAILLIAWQDPLVVFGHELAPPVKSFLSLLLVVLVAVACTEVILRLIAVWRDNRADENLTMMVRVLASKYSMEGADPERPMAICVLEHLKAHHDFGTVECPDCGGEGCKHCGLTGVHLDYTEGPCGTDCPLRPVVPS
jgi:hypothetical protein